MSSENLNGGRPAYSAYKRFLLLLLGEAIAGFFLYGIFTFMPMAVQMVITLTSWVVIMNDNIFHPQKNRSLGSLLCGITAIPVFSCFVAWRITHEDVWSRLMLVGGCLMAALIFSDRRQDA
jgi:ABC-type sugar transport system permease subunit